MLDMEGGSFTGMCCWFGCRLIKTSNDENNYQPTILLLQAKAITILIARFYKVNALVFFFLATAGLVAANCLLHYTDQVFILQKIYHWLSFIPLLRTQLQVHWISDKLTKVISTQLEFNCNNLPFLSYDSANNCPAKSALGGLR